MYSKVVFFALLGFASAGGIVDLNCTDGTNFLPTAFNCDNIQADTSCQKLYKPDAGMVAGADVDRPQTCFSEDGTAIDEELKALAIETCPKSCGYCCESSAFKCDNARLPRISCSTITDKMCKDPLWREVIAADCPAVCGFCNLGGCIDAAPDCNLNPSICFMNGLETFVQTNCKRTCGLCESTAPGATTKSPTNPGTCVDADPSCPSFVKNGFCTNSFYNNEIRKKRCQKSCGLC